MSLALLSRRLRHAPQAATNMFASSGLSSWSQLISGRNINATVAGHHRGLQAARSKVTSLSVLAVFIPTPAL